MNHPLDALIAVTLSAVTYLTPEAKAWDKGSGSFAKFLDEAYRQHQIEHHLWLMGIPLEALCAIEPTNPPWSPPTLPCECPE